MTAKAKRARRQAPISPDSILKLKVMLAEVEPPVWRRILVPASDTLLELHRALQAAMGWTDSHLHRFELAQQRYGLPEMGDDGVADERSLPLFEAFEAAAELLYEYDFGDGWKHRVRLEQVLPVDPLLRYPRCIDGGRACPPEDCGGAPGYEGFLSAISNPRDERHQELVEWIGGRFDPEAFNLAEANARLSTLASPKRRKSRSAGAASKAVVASKPGPAGSFHHLAIQVTDLPRAERFYCDVLGLQVKKRWLWNDGRPGERSIWLSLGDGFIALEACDQPVPTRAFRDPLAGLRLFAITIPAADRAAWEQRLGVAIVHRTRFTLYVRDPEGNRIGLSHHPDEVK